MSYIGRGLDKISNIEHLDTITFDGSSSYSLTKSSVAFTPNSAQSLLVSIDGVVQSNNFTVSGSTIDFGVAVPSTSTCDFIKHFGTGVAFTPADGTVGLNQLSATGTKDATTFLRGDNTFATPSGGKILQVVSTTKTDPFTSNLTSFTDVTGLTVSITPSSSSNKVLIFLNFIVSCQTNARLVNINLLRGSTNIGQPASSGATTHAYNVDSDNANHVALHYLDSPATTSATTYKIQVKTNNTDNYISIGDRNSGDLDCISVISAMEVSA